MIALQLAVTLVMGIYVTATQTVVARRHAKVLKRMRTAGISDAGLLVATLAAPVVLGLVQLVIFVVIDVASGAPLPRNPAALVLALLGGLALVMTAALATTVVTPSPERSQITTLPLTFVLLGTAIALAVLPAGGWGAALDAIPGAGIGRLVHVAFDGAAGPSALLSPVVALLVWSGLFGYAAYRWFRWDPRTT